jgi:S-formylglutathione hydrolase FrmB
MAHLQCIFYSKALEMDTCVNVILPNEGDLSQTRVVFLLHGLSDNYSAWCRYTKVERYALAANVAVVMPEVQRSFYCDTVSGMAYFRYISQELPEMCSHFFHLPTDPKLSYIMGLSMGGFGALKCALNNPGRYAGCGSFSGALRMDSQILRNVLKEEELAALVGSDCKAGPVNDLLALASAAETLPPIYLSCGEQDRLYSMTVEFAAHLEKLGAAHRFDHRPGTHSWDFWDQSLRDCFAYLLKKE